MPRRQQQECCAVRETNISSSREQKRHRGEEEEENTDRISQLPDEVLCSILSLLPVKEAAQTKILSTRWRPLFHKTTLHLSGNFWRHVHNDIFRGCPLHIDASTIFPKRKQHDDRGWDILMQYRSKNLSLFLIQELLPVHSGPIHSLRLTRFFFGAIVSTQRGRVASTMCRILAHKGIRELSLSHDPSFVQNGPLFLLPDCILSCESLRVLKLKRCQLPFDTTFGLPSLRVLKLERSVISEGLLLSLLSKCPVLETLELNSCRGVPKIMLCSRSLRELTVHNVDETTEIVIEDAPNLEELVLGKDVMEKVAVAIVHAPKLKDAQILGEKSAGLTL